MEAQMYKIKPWLRFIVDPGDGSGGAAGDGAGGAAAGGTSGDGSQPGRQTDGGSGDRGSGETPGDDDGFRSPESKKAVLDDLYRERDARKQLEEKLRQYEERDLTDQQKAKRDADAQKTRVGELEQDLSAERKRADQLEAAFDAGLPKSWAGRLQGETPEELAADAQKIADDLGARDTRQTPGAGAAGGDALAATSPGMGSLRAAYATS